MDYESFIKNTSRLSDWFGKRLNEGQADIMFNALRYIPGEAYGDIVKSIIEQYKPTPGYFPDINAIKNKHFEWRREHPEKVFREPEASCVDCHGKGFLWATKRQENGADRPPLVYTYVYRCGACSNWKRHLPESTSVPLVARALLSEFDSVFPPLDGEPGKKPLRQMVDDVGVDATDDSDTIERREAARLKLREQARQFDEVPF